MSCLLQFPTAAIVLLASSQKLKTVRISSRSPETGNRRVRFYTQPKSAPPTYDNELKEHEAV